MGSQRLHIENCNLSRNGAVLNGKNVLPVPLIRNVNVFMIEMSFKDESIPVNTFMSLPMLYMETTKT